MVHGVRNIYGMVLLLCMAGYGWMYWSWPPDTVCLVKALTGVPCPSCGTTRSVQAILLGRFKEAAWINPLGYVALSALIFLPLWTIADMLSGRSSFREQYQRMECALRRPVFLISFAMLILLNWLWNVAKHI